MPRGGAVVPIVLSEGPGVHAAVILGAAISPVRVRVGVT